MSDRFVDKQEREKRAGKVEKMESVGDGNEKILWGECRGKRDFLYKSLQVSCLCVFIKCPKSVLL